MAIMMTKEDDKNIDLTQRIDADLREKMETSSKGVADDPDFTEDSAYVRDFKKTGKFAWVWVLLGVGAVTALIIVGLNH